MNCASGVSPASYCDYHEIVTSLSARNATNAEAMAASIAPPATMRAIVALRSADRVFSITLRIASKPCAAMARTNQRVRILSFAVFQKERFVSPVFFLQIADAG